MTSNGFILAPERLRGLGLGSTPKGVEEWRSPKGQGWGEGDQGPGGRRPHRPHAPLLDPPGKQVEASPETRVRADAEVNHV